MSINIACKHATRAQEVSLGVQGPEGRTEGLPGPSGDEINGVLGLKIQSPTSFARTDPCFLRMPWPPLRAEPEMCVAIC